MTVTKRILEIIQAWLVSLIKNVPAWILAVVVTAILGVIFQTQNVIARLGGIGADISFGERLVMTGYDVSHLGTLYAIFIALAFVIAFLAGGLVYRFAKFGRPVIYAVAGAAAIFVMLFAMKANFFDIHIIAGARDMAGISMQILAGGLGGFVFAKLSAKTEKTA